MTNPIYRKSNFNIPDGLIYLDGNSLGPLPKTASEKVKTVIEYEWGDRLIRGWNECGWMDQPLSIGNKIANLIGADEGSVVLGDTLSIKVYQALSAALKMRPERKVILSDKENFPSDLYMADGLLKLLGPEYSLKLVSTAEIKESIDESVAVVMLTQVDYRTGQLLDIEEITSLTHKVGAISVWDLAHSAGAVPLDIKRAQCEFAVGCTYKYLNGGPGAPAFIYIRPDIVENVEPSLAGWLGHEQPFAFEQEYRPASSIERMRVGTPSVLQMAALDTALDIWKDVDMQEIRSASIELCELFITEVEKRCPQLTLVSPRDAKQRGSQVSFAFEHGYAVIQALIDAGVIGDFRQPNIMRFGFTPLYINEEDVLSAVSKLEKILSEGIWKDAKYLVVKSVT